MRRRASIWVAASSSLWLSIASCQRPAEEHVVQPAAPSEPVTAEPAKPADQPALPTGVDVPVPGSAVAEPTPSAKVEPEAPTASKPSAPATSAKQPEPAKPKPATTVPKQEPTAKSEPAPVEPVKPAPVEPVKPAPAPAPEPPAKTGVKVPRTAHVRAEIPNGMQALLDADTRMQPWVDKAMAIVERCYVSKGFGTSATIVGVVTMHPNARPDVDVTSLPPTLAAVVACATGDLMRNRMPLFTGPEGQRHTLKIRFTP